MSRIFKIGTYAIDLESIEYCGQYMIYFKSGHRLDVSYRYYTDTVEAWEEYIESKEVEQKSEGNITHCEAEERCRSLLNWLMYDIGEETGSEETI